MPSWQIAELASVYDYLMDRLGHIFDKAEETFVTFVLNEHPGLIKASSMEAGYCRLSQHLNYDLMNHSDSSSDDRLLEAASDDGSKAMSESDSNDEDESRSVSLSDGSDSYEHGVGTDRFDCEDNFFASYTKLTWHNDYMSYMISLGLPSLYRLFKDAR